ncbi:MAG TPA: hypothetical protein VK860_14795 [Ilumatobacteraceae bacterium]|nr:hypothetical protein [Ilumatobacteraceae bacterium]
MRRSVISGLLAVAVVVGLPSVTLAAPKAGCPAGASGWHEGSVEAIAEIIFAGLLVPGPSPEVLEGELQALDRDDDGLCLLTRWGDKLNPKSHWYRVGLASDLREPVTLFLVVDNNANARK